MRLLSILQGSCKNILVSSLCVLLLILSNRFVGGAQYPKPRKVKDAPFSFLDEMIKQAKADMDNKVRESAQEALEVFSFICVVKDGKLFTVDSEDEYVGVEIRLHNDQISYCGLASQGQEQLVVDYYFITKKNREMAGLLKSGQLRRLREEAMEFVKIYPDYARGWEQLGYTNLALGMFQDAKKDFYFSVKLAPEFPKAIVGEAISDIYVNQGKLTTFAKDRLSLLKEKDPDLSVFRSDEVRHTAEMRSSDWNKVIDPAISKEIPGYRSPLKEDGPRKFKEGEVFITAKDLPALKGTYEGRVTFGIQVGVASSACKLEILNDAAPVRARLTIDDIPGQIANQLGLMSGQNVFESDDGVITTAGTIMWTGKQPKNFFEVSGAGAKKLKALYYFQGLRGDATLNKK